MDAGYLMLLICFLDFEGNFKRDTHFNHEVYHQGLHPKRIVFIPL